MTTPPPSSPAYEQMTDDELISPIHPRLTNWAWREQFMACNLPKNGVGLIPLNRRMVAEVDAKDYDRVRQYVWFLNEMPRGFYACAKVEGRTVKLERFILNPPPKAKVRHRDNNGLNCRRSNLEVCSHGNVIGKAGTWDVFKTSRFKGVCRHNQGRGYTAQIGYKGKKIHIGYFQDEVEAAIARDKKVIEFYGSDAYLNFPLMNYNRLR